jgi:hypothetical protein
MNNTYITESQNARLNYLQTHKNIILSDIKEVEKNIDNTYLDYYFMQNSEKKAEYKVALIKLQKRHESLYNRLESTNNSIDDIVNQNYKIAI